MESIKIALLGLGTVGTGVYKVLKTQKEEMVRKLGAQVEIKKILVRNLEKAAAKPVQPKSNNRFNNFHQREYDFTEYEKKLLNQ